VRLEICLTQTVCECDGKMITSRVQPTSCYPTSVDTTCIHNYVAPIHPHPTHYYHSTNTHSTTMQSLAFQSSIFLDMAAAETCLTVMGRSLGADRIITDLCELYAQPQSLVFLLGAPVWLQTQILEDLVGEDVVCVPKIVTEHVKPSVR
jgi:hypothetical protein